MPSWGLVSTVKAAEDKVLAFVAHHFLLGAARLWIYFDDPADPAYPRIAALPRVTATLCTDAYWATRGGRHERHQNRQARNARTAQRACTLDWLGHMDVDEFLYARRPVADILSDVPPDIPDLRMEPFEAMHESLPDDIFTARQFRGPLHDRHTVLRPLILGDAAALIPKGHLSHANGKSFCRPALPGVTLRLHAVFLNQQRTQTPFHPELHLLHFHAQDYDAWRKALPFRLERGAYQYHPALQAYLTAASDAQVSDFYLTTQTLTPAKTALLQAQDRLITTDLTLRAKVVALLG